LVLLPEPQTEHIYFYSNQESSKESMAQVLPKLSKLAMVFRKTALAQRAILTLLCSMNVMKNAFLYRRRAAVTQNDGGWDYGTTC
jgi:endoglucanase Acf2